MQYYLKLVRAFPLRPITTKSAFDESQKVLSELAQKHAILRPGEQAYVAALSGLMQEYEQSVRAKKRIAAREAQPAHAVLVLGEDICHKQGQSMAAKPVTAPEAVAFGAFLARLSPKDRLNAERHVGVCEAEANCAHVDLWRRLAGTLSALAPFSAKLMSARHAQFFVRDGKYRMQMFALEDLRDGKITIYCPDILQNAVEAGVLSRSKPELESASTYQIGRTDRHLPVETLDKATINPDLFYKDMIGWNRKAIRITLLITATEDDICTVEKLCAISAPQDCARL